jgi:hypothetical protein
LEGFGFRNEGHRFSQISYTAKSSSLIILERLRKLNSTESDPIVSEKPAQLSIRVFSSFTLELSVTISLSKPKVLS